jgi:hypothetical protein
MLSVLFWLLVLATLLMMAPAVLCKLVVFAVVASALIISFYLLRSNS